MLQIRYTMLCLAQTTYRSEEHTSELQSHSDLVCRLLLEKKKSRKNKRHAGVTRVTQPQQGESTNEGPSRHRHAGVKRAPLPQTVIERPARKPARWQQPLH